MNKKQLIGLIVAGLVFTIVCSASIFMNNWAKGLQEDETGGFFSSLASLDELEEYTLPTTDYIGVVKVEGTIMDYSSTSILDSGTTYDHQATMDLIDNMMNSSSNKGLLLYVNSPGGSVYDSDELYLKLKEYKEETDRPVWVYMADEACSGGYYISMAGDKVYANRNTWTGSIGVIISMTNYKELFDKLGIKGEYITSGVNKSMGASDLDLTDEQRAILQSLVDESYEQFVSIVAEGRNMSVDDVKVLADGRIYSAQQALDHKLVDEISGYEDMCNAFSDELGGIEVYTPDTMEDPFGLSSLFGYFGNLKSKSDAEVISEFMENNGSGVPMYYAIPGQY